MSKALIRRNREKRKSRAKDESEEEVDAEPATEEEPATKKKKTSKRESAAITEVCLHLPSLPLFFRAAVLRSRGDTPFAFGKEQKTVC